MVYNNMSLPSQYILSFDDLETMFMTMYAPPIAYHTLLKKNHQNPFEEG
jgi:hypothetical protein